MEQTLTASCCYSATRHRRNPWQLVDRGIQKIVLFAVSGLGLSGAAAVSSHHLLRSRSAPLGMLRDVQRRVQWAYAVRASLKSTDLLGVLWSGAESDPRQSARALRWPVEVNSQ